MQDGQLANTSFEDTLNASNFGKGGRNLVSTMNNASTAPTLSQDDLYKSLKQVGENVNKAKGIESPYAPTTLSSTVVDESGRYPLQLPGEDNEDLYGQMQSNWDKAAKGVLKGINLAGSTFIQGTLGLVNGLGSVISGGGLNSFYNNDLSNSIEAWNKSTENSLPNYYTAEERDAKWYSPANLFTANFVFDKLIKNAGFSVGAIYSGGVVAGAIKSTLGAIPLFNASAQASKMASAIEEGLSAVPATQRLSTYQNLIQQASKSANRVASILPSGGAERVLTSFLGAATEGGIEALQGTNEFRDGKISEYTSKYGYAPSGEDLEKINSASTDLGNARFGMNMALLTATNYIQLPRLLGSKYSSSRAIANTQAAELGEVGNIVKNEAGQFTKGFSTTLGRTIGGRAGKAVDRAANISTLFFSPSEAFEETSQYAIEKGVNDYYNKAYRGEGLNWLDSISEGYRKALSDKEGLESLLLGGLSGGLMQIKGNIQQKGLTGEGGRIGTATEQFISKLNSSPLQMKSEKWLKDMSEAASRGINLMQEGESYIRQGDVLEAKDNEADQMLNYLAVRIKNGRYDLVKDDINALKNQGSTEEGLSELKRSGQADENDDVQSYTTRLNNFQVHAANVNSLYNSLNLRYGGLTKSDGTRTFPEEVIDKMAYSAAKIADYDVRIPQLSSNLNNYGISIQPTLENIINNGTISEESTRDALNMINNLQTSLSGRTVTSDDKDILKSELRDVIELSLRRKEFLKEYESIKKNPNEYEKAEISNISGGNLSIPQGKGKNISSQDVQIGTTYSLSQPILRDGNKIILAPKITPTSQTLQGEIETTLPTGDSTFIPLSGFKNYDISPISNDNEEIATEFVKSVNKVIQKPKFQYLREEFSDTPKTPEEVQNLVNQQDDEELIDDIVKDLKPKLRDINERIEKERKESQELAKNEKLRKELELQQKDSDNNSSDVVTLDEQDTTQLNLVDKENSLKKAPLEAFLSKEADFYDVSNPKPHQQRRLTFLTNLARIQGSQKAARVKTITITKNNEAFYGLTGLSNFIKEDIINSVTPETRDRYIDENGNLRPEQEPIIKFYVISDNNNLYIVDAEGNKKSELSGNVFQEAITEGVFGVFHSSISGYTYSDAEGQKNYQGSVEDKELADKQLKDWRTKVLSLTDSSAIYDIENISRGIVLRDEEDKNVLDTALLKEKDLDRENLITVPTIEGQININDVPYNFAVGQPLLTNGSNVEFLNNRKFSPKEAEDLYTLFLNIVKGNERGRINNFLNSILYKRSPKIGETISPSQVYIQDNAYHFGENLIVPFTQSSFAANKDKIISYFTNAYQKTNTKNLTTSPFEEAYIDGGEVKFRTYSSYQRFLLSPIDNIAFLRTRAIRKMSPIDPTIISRYTTLSSSEFDFIPKQPIKEVPKPEIKLTALDVVNKKKGLVGSENISSPVNEAVNMILRKRKGTSTVESQKEAENIAKETPNLDPKLDIERRRQEELDLKLFKNPTNRGRSNENLFKEENALILSRQWPTSELEGAKVLIRIYKEINAKYDAKLAALNKPIAPLDLGEYRIEQELSDYKPLNIQKELTYIQAKTPFSVKLLDNIIQTPQGLYAWGSYKDTVIRLFNRAQEGTGYHEVFEGVWKEFTTNREKDNLIKEFRNRKGGFTFFDGISYSSLPYSEANEFQIKESLADEFANFILTGEKPVGNSIFKWFKDLWNFIKSITSGQIVSVDQLFSKIDAGKYKSVSYNPSSISENEEYKLADINYQEQYETIRGVAVQLMQEILNPNIKGSVSLTEFEESDVSVQEAYNLVYDRLENLYTVQIFHPDLKLPETQLKGLTQYWENIKSDWNTIKDITNEYLKTFSIIQTLNPDDVQEERTRKDDYSNRDYMDDNKYFENDAKNTASRSIKLLFATLPETIFNSVGKPASKRSSSTFMQQEIQYGKNFNSLLYQLVGINGYENKLNKLKELGKSFPNFERLYERLNNQSNTDREDSVLNDWKLKIRWFSVMSKQNPIAYTQFNQADGTSRTGTTNLDSSVKAIAQGWIDVLKNQALNSTSKLTTQANNGDLILNTSELEFDITSTAKKVTFLNQLSIPFTVDTVNSLSPSDRKLFNDGVTGFAAQLKKKRSYPLDDAQSLKSAGNLQSLAKAFIGGGNDFESTYFNMEGERRTKFISTNKFSRDLNDINAAETIEDLYKSLPNLKSVTDSVYLNRILFNQGERTSFSLNVGYIEGTKDAKGKPIPGERLSKSDRMVQEINQNLNGRYYVLVPADSKTQWLTNMKNDISFQDVLNNSNDWKNRLTTQFTAYYNTEKVSYLDRTSRGLRIGQGIFKELSNNYKMDDGEFSIALGEFINGLVLAQKNLLLKSQTITGKGDKFSWKGIDSEFLSKEFPGSKNKQKNLTNDEVNKILTFRLVNYMTNNVELQKLIFGDILEYKDPTKRYKLFLSPREVSVFGAKGLNDFLNEDMNKAGNTALDDNILGKTLFADEFPTITMSDLITRNESASQVDKAFQAITSTDAQAYSTLTASRHRRIKGGNWTKKDEKQYQFSMSRDRQLMLADNILTNLTYPKELQEYDRSIVEKGNPNISYIYVEKPIVSGHTSVDGVYQPIVDKFSIASFSYAAIRGTNFRAHYVKMMKQGIGYAIVSSGRKVGARGTNSFYNEDGTVNNEEYTSLINIPFSTFGVQSDTSSKKEKQTRGTQITKLVIINLYNAGAPISAQAGELAQQNIALLKEQTDIGYQKLLKSIGATDVDGQYRIIDKGKILKLVTNELLRREVTDSIKQQLKLNDEGELVTPFEALPNYTQIKNILYSYVDKFITSPKVSGGPKVQVSGALMEKYGIQRKRVNGKDIYYSEGLKFYTKEEPWIEVLLPFWAGKKLRKAGLIWNTDEELFDIINKSPDAQQILSGVGFRIPTQEINSIENFRIKGFLPEEMGDTIVVPEEITTKAGSDFDIDKLNTYLQNLYVDAKGRVRIIPYFGMGVEAKEKLKEWANEEAIIDLLRDIAKADPDAIDKLDFDEQEEEYNVIDKFYKQSIENEYFRNIQDILSIPENFERLITPNTADDLKGIRDYLVKIAPSEFTSEGNNTIINPLYMLDVRHNGQSVKRLVGISALAQTGTAISQLSPIIIDYKRILNLSWREQNSIGNLPRILLPHNDIDGNPTISNIKDRDGRYITDKISQYINGTVDVFNDSFLAQMNFNNKTAGIYLMLERLGVPNSEDHPIVSLFMNQPIIREYINQSNIDGVNTFVSKSGQDLANKISRKFKSSKKATALPTNLNELTELLSSSIERFYDGGVLSIEENATQKLILSEFLKCSVYSGNLFRLQQGTNYDTASLNDSYSVKLKEIQTKDAEINNVFSSVGSYLNSSFIQGQREAVGNSSSLLADVLKIENPVTQKYLLPFLHEIAGKYINNDDKLRVLRTLEESLFNYIIQTKSGINNSLAYMLMNEQTALVNELKKIKKQLKASDDTNILNGNVILKQLNPYIRGRNGNSTKNITLSVKARDVFTKNLYTNSFMELYNNPITQSLARSLVKLSFLQSGVSNSPISFKDSIPAELYSAVVNDALKYLQDEPTLINFVNSGSFYRNNTNNEDIVNVVFSDRSPLASFKSYNEYKEKLISEGIIEKGVKLPSLMWSELYRTEYVTHMQEVTDENGDVAYQKRLFKRVGIQDTVTIEQEGEQPTQAKRELYVQVNKWGDDWRAQEHYDAPKTSVFNNGYLKVDREVLDVSSLENFLYGEDINISSEGQSKVIIVPKGLPELDFNPDNSEC